MCLTFLLTGCGKDQLVKTEYIDRVVVETVPESLVVVPNRPYLPSGNIKNEDLVNMLDEWELFYEQVFIQFKGIEEFSKKALSE